MNEELKYVLNRYSDVVVDPDSLPDDELRFGVVLESLLHKWKGTGMGTDAVWLEIPIDKCHLITVAVKMGFCGHHCTEKYFMLTMWMGNKDDV